MRGKTAFQMMDEVISGCAIARASTVKPQAEIISFYTCVFPQQFDTFDTMNYLGRAVAMKTRVPNQRAKRRRIKSDYDKLLKEALSQPGVADYMELLCSQAEYNKILAALSNIRARQSFITSASSSIPYPITA